MGSQAMQALSQKHGLPLLSQYRQRLHSGLQVAPLEGIALCLAHAVWNGVACGQGLAQLEHNGA